MVRGVRGLLLLGLLGLALLAGELLWIQAVQHPPLPVAVTAVQAKAKAAAWLGDGAVTVRQEENAAVSRHLHERGMTGAFRQEAGDVNKPLVMWKVSSGAADVLVNRQTGRIEGIRGVTLGLFTMPEPERPEAVRQELISRFGLQSLSVSSIKKEDAGRLLLGFETGYRYEGLRETYTAELSGERWVAYSHQLEVVPSTGAKDLDAASGLAAGSADGSSVRSFVNVLSGVLLPLVYVAIVVWAFAVFTKRGTGGRRLYGEALVSLSMLPAYWLINPTLGGLVTGLFTGLIVFGVFVIVEPSPLHRRWREPGWFRRQVAAGYGVFGVLAGVSTLTGWIASLAGVWISDLQQQEALALSPWPVLLTGVAAAVAAVNEEVIYRKLGGFFLRRSLRSGIAVALLSSLLWALGHLSYQVSPWYYRIFELGLVIGPLFFWLYWRLGLGAVITGHFLYNCLLASVALAGAFGNYWGLLWLALPALVAGMKKGLRV